MKNPKLGDFLLWKGSLAKIVAEATSRQVVIEMIEDSKCPHCNGILGKKQLTVVVSSPLFQNNVQPVQTIS